MHRIKGINRLQTYQKYILLWLTGPDHLGARRPTAVQPHVKHAFSLALTGQVSAVNVLSLPFIHQFLVCFTEQTLQI